MEKAEKSRKPRLNFTLAEEHKKYLETWADEEIRSLSSLLEVIVIKAIRKRQRDEGEAESELLL